MNEINTQQHLQQSRANEDIINELQKRELEIAHLENKEKYWKRVRKMCSMGTKTKNKKTKNRIARVQKKRGQRGDKLFKRNNN